MDKNLEREMYRIPERRTETLEKGSVEQFEVIDVTEIKAILQENAEKEVKKQEFLSSNQERERDYELFYTIGQALEVLRNKKLKKEGQFGGEVVSIEAFRNKPASKEEELKYAA
ncbi:MAG: hypothetical protein LBQ02_03000 [Candidatus Nomurabacteria bacterium]|jgi:hypothetical protein|nr:hypothetical protein [Candidatus Nomurabacteria bacterium]